MAPFIRVTCPSCNDDKTVPFADIQLLHYSNDSEYVGFRCPTCRSNHMTPLPSAYSEALRRAGLPVVEVPDPYRSDAPVFTEDDLIAFGLELERTTNPLEGVNLG